MYFWSINDLVRTLGDRDLRDDESFPYFFIYVVLMTLATSVPEIGWNTWDTVAATGTVILTAAGVLYCYRANGGSAGTAFLSRFMAISWVMMIRLLVLFLAVFFAAAIVATVLGESTEEASWWDTLLVFGMEVLTYTLVAKHLRRVRVLRAQLDAVLAAQPGNSAN